MNLLCRRLFSAVVPMLAAAREDPDSRLTSGSGAPALGRGYRIGLVLCALTGAFWFSSGPAFASAIDGEWATGVSADAANVNAQINPGGADTTYHFQYGIADCSTGPCTSVPVPDADIGSGTSDVTVAQSLGGLTAGTTYHYRVVATTGTGTNDGPDHTFTTQAITAAGHDTCPNAAIRAQQTSAFLPDCRGYELVTPADKGSGEFSAAFGVGQTQAAPGGNALGYVALLPFPGAQSGLPTWYLASRGADGWDSQDLIPPQSTNTGAGTQSAQILGFSTDLSKAVLQDNGADDPALVPGEPANNQNLFLRDDTANSWQLVDVTAGGTTPAAAIFEGASADFSHILFASTAQLTAGAVAGVSDLYEWVGGSVRLVSLVPPAGDTSCGSGGPACVAAPNGGEAGGGSFSNSAGTQLNVVSQDGSKVFFTEVGGDLFVREDGARTVDVSASQKTNGSSGRNAPALQWVSPDGSKVFFTSCAELTNDSTADEASPCEYGGEGGDLYQYDVASGELTDLTVDRNGDPQGANVFGVLGTASDGSYVYFVADGVLAPGATLGDCLYAGGAEMAGSCNLYVSHDGATTFVAIVDAGNQAGGGSLDATDWESGTAAVTPDGTKLAFASVNSLTGYDNVIADGSSSCGVNSAANPTGDPRCSEVYLYDATDNKLVCASCNPTGARPLGASSLPSINVDGASGTTNSNGFYLKHYLSDDGSRVFFDSSDALVPQDSNGRQDVYEYEDGQPHLISSGTGDGDSTLLDASPDGSDVFFATGQPLVGWDTDSAPDIYDARVDGGFPGPPPSPIPCSGEDCHPLPGAAPQVPVMASATFVGPDDGSSPPSTGRPTVRSTLVRGTSFTVRVTVPAAGRIAITGVGVRIARESVSGPGTYGLRLTLTGPEQRLLARRHRLTVRLRVTFTRPGSAAAEDVTLTVRSARLRVGATRLIGGAK